MLELLALMTAFGGLKTAFGRYSQSNASQAYGLQTLSDALPPYNVVASTEPSLLIYGCGCSAHYKVVWTSALPC